MPALFIFCLCSLFTENYEISSISHVTMSPSRHSSLLSSYSFPLAKTSYSVISAFCTEDNIPQCISYINQVWKSKSLVTLFLIWFRLFIFSRDHFTRTYFEKSPFFSPLQELASLGLSSTCIEATSPGGAGLNAVPALNAMYELLQIHRRTMCSVDALEKEQLKKSSTLELMQTSNSRLKACMTAGLAFDAVYIYYMYIFFYFYFKVGTSFLDNSFAHLTVTGPI